MTLRFFPRLLSCVLLALATSLSQAADSGGATLRVGVLQFGTVNWGLDVMQAHNLAQKRGLNLKIVPLASGDASTVALQGGAVDVIVSDWIWVTRQRADGMAVTFAPYSNAVGSLMVKADNGMRGLADLKGKSIGISGGPYDKTWLLLRAYASKKWGMDLSNSVRPVYAAPPLLNELALSGQVDDHVGVEPRQGLANEGRVADIAVDEGEAGIGGHRLKAGEGAGIGELVQDQDGVIGLGDQAPGQGRADEAGAAGD